MKEERKSLTLHEVKERVRIVEREGEREKLRVREGEREREREVKRERGRERLPPPALTTNHLPIWQEHPRGRAHPLN